MSEKDLSKYLLNSEKKINAFRSQLTILTSQKKKTSGIDKARCILACLAKEKEIIDGLCIMLDACCSIDATRRAEKLKSELHTEIGAYNALILEWTRLTGQPLPVADIAIPEYIMSGVEYKPLPIIEMSDDCEELTVEVNPGAASYERESEYLGEEEHEAPAESTDYNAFVGSSSLGAPVSKEEFDAALDESDKLIAITRQRLEALERKKAKVTGNQKIECVLAGMMAEKKIIDELSAHLETCYNEGFDSDAKSIKKELNADIRNYNALVDEWNKLTHQTLPGADPAMADAIMSGRGYRPLPDFATAGDNSGNDYRDVKVLSNRRLGNHIKKNSSAIAKERSRYSKAVELKNQAKVEDRLPLLVDCIAIEKNIIDLMAEDLLLCCEGGAGKQTLTIKKNLESDIAIYNNLVKEYETLTGDDGVSMVSMTLPDDIISEGRYVPIPTVSFSIAPDPLDTSEQNRKLLESFAAGRALEDSNSKVITRAKLSEQITTQVNKNLEVFTRGAEFRISMLQSERDMTSYRYGKSTAAVAKTRREIAKEIKSIKKNYKKALSCENEDNKRYYSVVMADPKTVDAKKPNLNREKLASIRSRMIVLLNERDSINGKLLAIYRGEEVNADGSSVNQMWREIKNDAADRAQWKQRKLEETVRHLPASEREKKKIYDLMNQIVDAESTKKLSKYRLKKERLRHSERRALKKDIKQCNKLSRRADREITRAIKYYIKREKTADAGASWATGLGFVLLFVLVGIGLYVWFFKEDISALANAIAGIK